MERNVYCLEKKSIHTIYTMPHYTDYRYDNKEPPMPPSAGSDYDYDTMDVHRRRRKRKTEKRSEKTRKRRDGGRRRKRTEKRYRRRR
jgi:hypothetical protein